MSYKTFDQATRELRRDGWMPREVYVCGCDHVRLCNAHAEIRAVEHCHPETIPAGTAS